MMVNFTLEFFCHAFSMCWSGQLFVYLKFSYSAFTELYKMSLLSPSWFRLAAESGTVLGSRPDFLHHTTGTVPGGYGSICRGELCHLKLC